MNRAMFTGLSGTTTYQSSLDIIANNIVNANTPGYKAGRATFQDVFYETLQAGAANSGERGGANPAQIGSGVSIGSIQVNMTQGALQQTNQPLDAALDGEGAFVLMGPQGRMYARDGAFTLDDRNTLVGANTGLRVQGWMATDGVVSTTQPLGDLRFPIGQLRPVNPTGAAILGGNLDALGSIAQAAQATSVALAGGLTAEETLTFNGLHSITLSAGQTPDQAAADLNAFFAAEGLDLTCAVEGDRLLVAHAQVGGAHQFRISSSLERGAGGTELGGLTAGSVATYQGQDGAQAQAGIAVYDSLGMPHQVTVAFTRLGTNAWQVEATCGSSAASGQLQFDSAGSPISGSPLSLSLTLDNGAQSPQAISLDLGAMTQLGQVSSVAVRSQDGNAASALARVELGEGGLVRGRFSDGQTVVLGQVAVASFSNAAGLERRGDNLYGEGIASGPPQIGPPSTGGRGNVIARSLELANVDLTKAFVDMVTTQRSFQASASVISTANRMLEVAMDIAHR